MQQAEAAEQIRLIVAGIVQLLVDQPEATFVRAKTSPDGLIFEVSAAPTDIGKLVGRSGRTARALRTILHALAARSHLNIRLELPDHKGD